MTSFFEKVTDTTKNSSTRKSVLHNNSVFIAQINETYQRTCEKLQIASNKKHSNATMNCCANKKLSCVIRKECRSSCNNSIRVKYRNCRVAKQF